MLTAEISTEPSEENTNLERLERVSRMTEVDDLQGPHTLPYAPLCIKDPRDYFDSQQVNTLKALGDTGAGFKPMDCNLSTKEAYLYMTDQISEVKVKPMDCNLSTKEAYLYMTDQISEVKVRGLNNPVVQSEIALKVLNGLNQHLSSTKYHLGKNPQESVLDRLPIGTKELMHHWTSIQELLRHFWSSYPITTAYLYNKEIKESVQSDLRHHVSLLVQPMLQALDAAFAFYDTEQQKKSSKIGTKPNGYVQ